MARTFANRFNRLYQSEYFPEPQAFSFEQNLVKVPGLTGTGKMSKSAGEADTIYLDEEASVLNKKIMRAVSDSGPSEPGAPKSVPVQNLFDLMGLVCTPDTIQFFDDEYFWPINEYKVEWLSDSHFALKNQFWDTPSHAIFFRSSPVSEQCKRSVISNTSSNVK